MTTLQRSSVSFRRQGSSGRIWDDRPPLHDPKSGGLHPTIAFEKCQDHNNSQDNVAVGHPTPSGPFAATTPLPGSENEVDHPNPSSPPKSESKPRKWSFSSIFRRCVGTPA
ncbi:hypothetical protein U1Q18_012376 [Sarracenia purpurea var. burkii]